MKVLALDVGGANLKAADGLGYAAARPFALWRRPAELSIELNRLIEAAPPCDHLVVTMTGELADCYATKREGVQKIVEATLAAAGSRQTLVYLTDGTLATPKLALTDPLAAAASNWHALATFVAQEIATEAGLLIDVGSTTTDVIPLVDGNPAAAGRTDPARLGRGELVYAGVERTPVCAIVRQIPWREGVCPVAAELFATTRDVYLLLGELPEDPTATDTADGRPATREAARDRMARVICADRETFTMDDAEVAALAIVKTLEVTVADAVRKVMFAMPRPPRAVVVAGAGEFLARRVLARLHLAAEVVSLSVRLGPDISRAAPAHALAVLARRQLAG